MPEMKQEESKNEEVGKIFVGGLSWETSNEKLEEYFSQYGEVTDSVVMVNNETGKSRGFGFITYKDPSCVAKVLSSGPHELDGRTIDPKVCSARDTQQNKKAGHHPKVFLGGLPLNCTETDLRSFFSRYGTVVEVVLMYDQEKKKPRGFGFLSFETEDSVKQVCAEHFVKINGKKIEVKHAEPREKKSNSQPSTSQTQQWPTPQMGQGGWAPGTSTPNMGPSGPMPGPMGPNMNNMMTPPGGGYPGWCGAPYGPQGWGPQPGPYCPPNNGWGWGPGFGGPYGPQYGQPGYGYGFNYGGGFGGGPIGGPPATNTPAPGTEGQSAPNNNNASNNSNSNNNTNPGTQPNLPAGMGNYSQDPSNFGPARTGFGPGFGPNYNAGGNFPGNFGNQGDPSRTSGPQAQGYHPYKRQ